MDGLALHNAAVIDRFQCGLIHAPACVLDQDDQPAILLPGRYIDASPFCAGHPKAMLEAVFYQRLQGHAGKAAVQGLLIVFPGDEESVRVA